MLGGGFREWREMEEYQQSPTQGFESTGAFDELSANQFLSDRIWLEKVSHTILHCLLYAPGRATYICTPYLIASIQVYSNSSAAREIMFLEIAAGKRRAGASKAAELLPRVAAYPVESITTFSSLHGVHQFDVSPHHVLYAPCHNATRVVHSVSEPGSRVDVICKQNAELSPCVFRMLLFHPFISTRHANFVLFVSISLSLRQPQKTSMWVDI